MKSFKSIRGGFLAATIAYVLAVGSSAVAQDVPQLRIATGSSGGTIDLMFASLKENCKASVDLIGLNKTSGGAGSVANLAAVADNNEANAGFVQHDVLLAASMRNDMSKVKTLLAMHQEQVLFVGKYPPTAKGMDKWFSAAKGWIGKGAVNITNVDSIGAQPVGATGGAIITAGIVKSNADLRYEIREFKTHTELMAALDAGEIAAAVMTGGRPFPTVSALNASYFLLPMSGENLRKLDTATSPYKKTTVSYPNIGAKDVPTVYTDSLLVTRVTESAKTNKALAAFRECAIREIKELKGEVGTHAAWQTVDTENHGRWAWYELPTAAPVKTVKK